MDFCGVLPVLLCTANSKAPMKHHILPASILFCLAISANAQEEVTVTTAPNNAMQTWYSLQNGVVDSKPLAEWDIAFEITGITGSIQVNTAKGVQVYKAPFAISQWADIDTTGLAASWPAQHNSETDWSSGALNQGLTANPFDLGWGIYNMVTHNVTGDSCFVVKLANGQWKKLRIDGYASGTDQYTWTWADLDGQDQQSNTLVRSNFAGKNFGYVSLEANTVFDWEPATDTWDLLFTRYISFVQVPFPAWYAVAGVFQNRAIEVQRVDGVDPSFSDWAAGSFSPAKNGIGADWKIYNQQTFQWEYATDRVHFVKDRDGNVWKLIFTAYGGGATGDMTFTQELLSLASVQELGQPVHFSAFPNPVSDGRVNILLEAPARALDMLLFDANGRQVRAERIAGADGLQLRNLDVSGLAAGLYTLRLMGEGVHASTRIIIQ